MSDTKDFFEKKGISTSDVMYITRDGRKTVISLANGAKVETFNPIKGITELLPKDEFECINKGIVISLKYISSVGKNEYIMKDGVSFAGRVRASKKKKADIARQSFEAAKNGWEEYAVLDRMPLAFCIIELVFNEMGHGMDFIFRYCNREMENLEGKTIGEMIGKSFYEVFENGDKKWLVTYADVALNGIEKVIESYSPEIDANLRIYCFQPRPNYCACALVKI